MNPTRTAVARAATQMTEIRPEEFTIGFEFEFCSAKYHEQFADAIMNHPFLSRWPVGVVQASYGAHRKLCWENRYKAWHVTDDSSICCTNHRCPEAIELVTPAFDSLSTGLVAFKEIWAFLRKQKCSTNSSCGLHVTFGHSRINDAFSYLDPIKLAWALGDESLLSSFGRSRNPYCESYWKAAVRCVRREIESNRTDLVHYRGGREKISTGTGPKLTLENLKDLITTGRTRSRFAISGAHHLSVSLSKADHSLVEFRSMGGNYLGKPITKLTSTILHMANTLAVALDHTVMENPYIKDIRHTLQLPENRAH